ncbi:UDP-N-acetylbacillosamine N-acetyltransferase [Lacibacter cauensis]|uniref:UDP-N-acetylbacillosamine N-acetyltransferase n=1 Tax=Lacibacter cauensis TaxID=510947 RepID=A0A562SKA0_9BACT|nr:acetyltransferase [Lacibacter cauensis]TWI81424.1 UDP-N-acetylbacillosamine N-acetyltransferase [Lacibacter cauensis]
MFYILGKSEGYLSFLLETIGQLGFTTAVLVNNQTVPSQYPYQNALVELNETDEVGFAQRQAPAQLVLGAGKPKTRKKIVAHFLPQLRESDAWVNLVSANASIASTANMGKGIYIEPGVVVSAHSQLGDFVFLNRQSSVGHHTTIEPFCSIMPGTHIAGFCTIGAGTMLGMGTVVFDGVKIGRNCIIGGGSVVTRDIPEGVVAFGNPCKPVKELSADDLVV